MTRAIVIGAERAFGDQIVSRLRREGYEVLTDLGGSGAVDVLVTNAPVQGGSIRFLDVSDDQMHAALGMLVLDVAAAAQDVLPRMGRGGRIVHVAARGHLGAWGGAHLMAANAALVALTRSMALELAGEGIRVNALAPDFVGERWDTEAARKEVAAAVAFLAGAEITLLTGETLLLESGRSLRMSESRKR